LFVLEKRGEGGNDRGGRRSLVLSLSQLRRGKSFTSTTMACEKGKKESVLAYGMFMVTPSSKKEGSALPLSFYYRVPGGKKKRAAAPSSFSLSLKASEKKKGAISIPKNSAGPEVVKKKKNETPDTAVVRRKRIRCRPSPGKRKRMPPDDRSEQPDEGGGCGGGGRGGGGGFVGGGGGGGPSKGGKKKRSFISAAFKQAKKKRNSVVCRLVSFSNSNCKKQGKKKGNRGGLYSGLVVPRKGENRTVSSQRGRASVARGKKGKRGGTGHTLANFPIWSQISLLTKRETGLATRPLAFIAAEK